MKISMISFGPVETKSNGYFIRCYHVARSLVELGHEVRVLQFPEKKSSSLMKFQEGIKFINLKGNEVNQNRFSRTFKNILTFDPFHSIMFQLYSLIELIRFRNHLKSSDIIFVESALIPFGIILSKVFKKRVILDTHCINKLLALNFRDGNFLVYCIRKILWDILERFATKFSDVIIVVSEQERDFVQTEYEIPESNIFVVPNVIEIERRDYPKEELANLRRKWGLENKIIVTFVGNLKSVQNRDAVEYIINDLAPYFRVKRKDIVFLIIGEGKENFRCDLSNIIFTGYVEDLAPLLEISDIYIAPLRVGSGVKTKVLKYMAHGKPIVSTPIGVEGIKMSETEQSIVITEIETFPKKLLNMIEIINRLQYTRSSKIIGKLYSEESMRQKIDSLLRRVTLSTCFFL